MKEKKTRMQTHTHTHTRILHWPPFSALSFRSGAYHFHKLPKNPFRSITMLHFLADFAVPETIIFLFFSFFNPFISSHGRRSRTRQRRGVAAVPEIRIFTLKTDQARSGDSHFHAQKGSSSFPNIWGWSPPPPPDANARARKNKKYLELCSQCGQRRKLNYALKKQRKIMLNYAKSNKWSRNP